jgi:hypothetical protein
VLARSITSTSGASKIAPTPSASAQHAARLQRRAGGTERHEKRPNASAHSAPINTNCTSHQPANARATPAPMIHPMRLHLDFDSAAMDSSSLIRASMQSGR